MTSHYVVSAIRRHWLLVAATAILGGFVAAVYAFTATPEYVASTNDVHRCPASGFARGGLHRKSIRVEPDGVLR